MRYGRAKVGLGAGNCVAASLSVVRGDDAGLAMSLGDGMVVLVDGGGSIAELLVGALDGTTGSGSAVMASSSDDVSNVICAVGFALSRWV